MEMPIDEARLVQDLVRFGAIASISADPRHIEDVHRSAQTVAEAFRELGMKAKVVSAQGGLPAVIGRREGPEGAPTVLLYAHHDVQPVGDRSSWSSDPFTVTARSGRLYGRGTADDKGAIAVHLEALRCLGPDLPVTIAILIEGEEEVGSPTLSALLSEHLDQLDADVVIAPDSVNIQTMHPSLTVSLRGLLNVIVTVQTSQHQVHSGLYGGAVPDAIGALVRILASMSDDVGAVAIEGLMGAWTGASGQSERDIRRQSGLLEGVELIGRGTLGERVWDGPAVTITGIDAPPAAGAANVLTPRARAAVSVRLTPEQDPSDAMKALEAHVRSHTPWGADVTLEVTASGAGWRAEKETPGVELALRSLTEAFGSAPVAVGVGGGIPFIAALVEALPAVDVVVTAIQDPQSHAHAPDESVALSALVAATQSEMNFLAALGSDVAIASRTETSWP